MDYDFFFLARKRVKQKLFSIDWFLMLSGGFSLLSLSNGKTKRKTDKRRSTHFDNGFPTHTHRQRIRRRNAGVMDRPKNQRDGRVFLHSSTKKYRWHRRETEIQPGSCQSGAKVWCHDAAWICLSRDHSRPIRHRSRDRMEYSHILIRPWGGRQAVNGTGKKMQEKQTSALTWSTSHSRHRGLSASSPSLPPAHHSDQTFQPLVSSLCVTT